MAGTSKKTASRQEKKHPSLQKNTSFFRLSSYFRTSTASLYCHFFSLPLFSGRMQCRYNVDIMKLLLWEALLGNWGAVGNSESDIAIEEFNPYNSHYIYEIMLSVDSVQGDLFEGTFKEMWPELLDYPFNPPDTRMDWIKHWLQQIGLFQHLKRQRYRFDRWKFHRLTGMSQE